MKPEIQALFTDKVITAAAMRFAIDPDHIAPLNGFENYVCECVHSGKPHILRLSHDSHRVAEEIKGELDWLDYLSANDVPVCRPLRSRHDRLVEVVESNDSTFSAVVFEKAPGQAVRRDDQTSAMTINRGRLLGKLHALTKHYQPSENITPRPHWHLSDDYVNFPAYLDSADTLVVQKFYELIERLKSIPSDTDSYGLIHADAHTGNMFFDGDQPTLFDFDDCGYDFFISDIAISLFYAVLFLPDEVDQEEYARQFLCDMFAGYREEKSIDNQWLDVIPMILKRREIILYVVVHRGFDINNLNDWGVRYMDGRRERIENEVPVLDIDFAEFV